MKTAILTLLLAIKLTVAFNQTNTFPSSGSVGIGTTSPSSILEISEEINAPTQIRVRNHSLSSNARAGYSLWNGPTNGDVFAFLLNGKNYTGVAGWDNRLSIQAGSGIANGIVFYAAQGGIQFSTTGTNNPDIYVAPNGNIGFSTKNPSSKLSVNGNVESKEIQVKATIADYVFADDYSLMSLEALEAFIKKNKHLPNVYSEKDQIANNGNIPLGEVTMSLLEKIEELTLHVIELNKKIKELEAKK
jgi:hypothetical protein